MRRSGMCQWGTLPLVFVFLLVSLSGCDRVAADQAVTVRTAVAAAGSIETTVDITGVLAPAGTEDISAKLSGIVQAVRVKAGDKIKAGDTLVLIDTKELEAQMVQAEAALAVAEDQAVVAESNLSAAQSAAVAAEEALTAAQALIADQAAKAQNDVASAQKQLETVGLQNEVQIAQARKDMDAAQKNYDRAEQLFNANLVSRVEFDNAQTALDTAEAQYNLVTSSAESALLAAQTALEQAQSAYTQASGSAADNQLAAAQSSVVGAKGQEETARAQYEATASSAVEQAQAALDAIRLQMENADVKAASDGVVINRNVNPGEFAQAGAPLFTVADMSTLLLEGTIAQEVIPYVTVGQSVEVVVDIFPDSVLEGKVESVGPMAVSTGSYFPVAISIENTDNALMAGVSAHASIQTAKEGVIVVPSDAVVENEGQTYVFILENGLAVKRTVVTGLDNMEMTEILRGVEIGETFIAEKANDLFDQMPVTVDDTMPD